MPMTNLHNRVIAGIGEPAAQLAVIHGAQTMVECPAVPARRAASHGYFGVRMKPRYCATALARMTIEQRVRPPGRGAAPVAQHPTILVALAATAIGT